MLSSVKAEPLVSETFSQFTYRPAVVALVFAKVSVSVPAPPLSDGVEESVASVRFCNVPVSLPAPRLIAPPIVPAVSHVN